MTVGSESFNVPTPLRQTSRIPYVSSNDNISFNPTTPHSTDTSQSCHKPVQHQLSFSSSDDEDSSAVDIPLPSSTAPLQISMDFSQQPHSKYIFTISDNLDDYEEEEDFQTVLFEDNH